MDGQATGAQLNFPLGICTDSTGNLYIADYRNHRVRKVSPAGIITTVAGCGERATGRPSRNGFTKVCVSSMAYTAYG